MNVLPQKLDMKKWQKKLNQFAFQKPEPESLIYSDIDIALLGEPGHGRGGLAVVVGWGRTYTKDDYKTGLVASAAQQQVHLTVESNEDCLEKYQDLFNVNLSSEIR